MGELATILKTCRSSDQVALIETPLTCRQDTQTTISSVDIWSEIFKLISFSTAKRFRLVDKRFATLGAVLVLKVVYATGLAWSLAKFENIAEPTLLKHVQKII